jgi:hypothetical protein
MQVKTFESRRRHGNETAAERKAPYGRIVTPEIGAVQT